MARTISGKPITAAASAAPVQRNEKTMPRLSAEKAAHQSLAPERDEQEIAGHDGRQDQRQMDDAVENGFPEETSTRQQPCDQHCQRHAGCGRPQRDFQAEQNGLPLSLRKCEPLHSVENRKTLFLEGGNSRRRPQEL